MTSISFEAAIKLPDNDASHLRLGKLVSARDFSSANLPSVADDYLKSFCDTNSSTIRRRWIGIALTGMLEMPAVAAHIGASTKRLRNLGSVILSSTEQEQIKIVAGIIIRQALEQGIEYSSFWSTEKVRHSVPSFPHKADAGWMQKFQDFLDTLSDLALANPSGEPSIAYLVSLFASDGFKWRESSATFPIALIEAGVLTIVAPDEHLKDCQFVEIPIEHILSTQPEPSKLHNSQAQRTEHEPWDLVITLRSQPWSYRLNSAQRIATDISLMFKHSADALDWERCIKDHQKASKPHFEVSRNLPMDASSPSLRITNTRRSLRNSSQLRRTERVPSKKYAADSSDATTPPLQSQHPSSTSKRTTYSKGKLPRVSQATKQNIFKNFNAEDEDLDVLIGSKKNIHTTSSDTSSAAPSPQRKSRSSKAASSKEPVKTKTKARTSHNKNEADDDEDFIPSQTRPKKRTNPKRKAAPDAMTDDKPRKRSRKEPSKGVKSNVTSANHHVRTRALAEPPKAPSPVPSSQHTLIGGLLGLQRPAKVADSPFKKPTLPARVAQTPSTPPSRKLSGAPVRPQTPVEARRCSSDHSLHYMASSPAVSEGAEEDDGRHEITADTAMLSSNSKPTPASPNAESTAISGHADCYEVASEKKTGDWQTAKSDPFSRRSAGKATSFIRRLTGEEATDEYDDPEIGVSVPMFFLGAGSSRPETGTSRSMLQKKSWERKESTQTEIDANKARSQSKDTITYTDSKEVDAMLQQAAGVIPREGVALENEPTACTLISNKQIIGSIQPSAQANEQDTELTRNLADVTQQVMDQPQRDAEHTQQAIDGTQMPGEDDAMLGDDTLIVDDEDDQQAINHLFNASSVHFCSSPPCSDSPSSHSSTSAIREPLTDPPLPTSQAEEMEWEASLQPHQRGLHDLMIRTSKRVMRHIIDNETSVDDIAETYAQDGEHVLSTLIQRHDTDYDHVFQGMESTKTTLRKDLERAARQMAKDRKRVGAIA
jgi:hypothetical protein